MKQILPGATLGVLGGGQLGSMFCVSARTMGYRVAVLDPDSHSPAGRIADHHIRAEFDDQAALDNLASLCDVITTEFENVPAHSLRYLATKRPVYPAPEALDVAQNRNREKQFARSAGLLPVPYCAIHDGDDIATAISRVGLPAILKSAMLGYDGKGQQVVTTEAQCRSAWQGMGGVECVLERKIDLVLEVSAIVARNTLAACCFPVAENQHRNGILHCSIVPARVAQELLATAQAQALALANALDYIGVLAVEFFIARDGTLYFNEMAPRPHNSGHYTKDACVTSQFEQQVRMMCGLPPGDVRLLSPVVMVNLLGDLWEPDWLAMLQQPSIKLHLYGKQQARAGRKMGHFNVLAENVETALAMAQSVYDRLVQNSSN
jgi:5-(carboxyamino)imidazole ribonucleotide synthase